MEMEKEETPHRCLQTDASVCNNTQTCVLNLHLTRLFCKHPGVSSAQIKARLGPTSWDFASSRMVCEDGIKVYIYIFARPHSYSASKCSAFHTQTPTQRHWLGKKNEQAVVSLTHLTIVIGETYGTIYKVPNKTHATMGVLLPKWPGFVVRKRGIYCDRLPINKKEKAFRSEKKSDQRGSWK